MCDKSQQSAYVEHKILDKSIIIIKWESMISIIQK
jgi:hypothetical protein